MTRRYYISGEVADGDYLSELMSAGYSKAELSSILFYSDEFKTVATPSGGEVILTLSPDQQTFRTVDNGTFAAVEAYSPERKPPNAANLAVQAKLSMSGVTGVTHFTATLWRA